MARLRLIQKQKPGSGNWKPILRTQAGIRSQTKAAVGPARNNGAMDQILGRQEPSRSRARGCRQECRHLANWIQELFQALSGQTDGRHR